VSEATPAGEELRLDVGWGELGALAWPRPGGIPALCLSGWMDNAASFIPLAGALRSLDTPLDLVALDHAGHGRSDHRPEHGRYYFFDYLFDLDAALDALGWDQCWLIGHSLGSTVVCSFAAADPERVRGLVLLDGLGVMTEEAAGIVPRLRGALRTVRQPRAHRRAYPQPEDAARVRRANNPMEESSARLLVRRALHEAADGWRWRTDPRIMWQSPNWLTENQALALLRAVECPVLAVYSPFLHRYLGERLAARRQAVAELRCVEIEGGHHLHMDDPAPVAGHIDDFLASQGSDHE
jgi:pimeloyl-ACP methyl ester carboxylesterase